MLYEVITPKMANSIDLDYPKEKLKIVWVTDGSNDTTVQKLRNYPDVQIIHQNDRKGKTAAINRAMPYIHTPFVVFCDANTLLDSQAIKNVITSYSIHYTKLYDKFVTLPRFHLFRQRS